MCFIKTTVKDSNIQQNTKELALAQPKNTQGLAQANKLLGN